MPRGKKTAKEMPVIYFPVDAFNERLGEARSLVDGVAKYFEDYGIDLFTEKNPNIVSVIAKRMRSIHAGLNDILNDAVVLHARNISVSELDHRTHELRQGLQFWADNFPDVVSESGVNENELRKYFEVRATSAQEAELFNLSTDFIQTMTEYIDRFEEMGIRDNWRHFMNNRKAQGTGRPAFDYSVWSTWVCPREWRKAASAKASK